MAQRKIGRMVSWKLSEETIQEIDRIAERRGMSKSAVIRMCLEAGLGIHRDLERFGIIQALDTGQNFVQWCREAAQGRLCKDPNQLSLFK